MLDARVAECMRAVTGGQATSVWRIDSAGPALALRVFRAHEHAILRRETNVLRAARLAGIRVPRVYALGTHDGRPALLLEWCAGSPVLSALEAQPRSSVSLGLDFGRLQRRLHQVRAPRHLRSDWIDWPHAADPAVAARLRALPRLTDRLLHLDFHPLNVLADAGRVTAVLDWTNAHAGDPRADYARTATILRLAPPLGPPAQRLVRAVFECAWRIGYGPPGPAMSLFYAWAGHALLDDLADRLAPAELEPARRWTAAWLRRATRLG